jgi:hypothetical protein
MPSLTISDEMFKRLAKQATALNLTIEQLIAPLLDLAAGKDGNALPMPAPTEARPNDWKKNFEAWMANVQARAHRYPSGFAMDDSRHSIYKGCGE